MKRIVFLRGSLCSLLIFSLGLESAQAQSAVAPSIVVSAQEIPSAYGAPPSFSQSRFSPTTNAYVLPAGEVYVSEIYEGNALRHEKPDHRITTEIEVGLPYRFNVAMEAELQTFDGITQATSISLEARYAFANWNKIPLNPTIFGEYKFGVGDLLHDERVQEEGGGEEMAPPDTLRRLSKLMRAPRHHAVPRRQEEDEEEFGRIPIPDAVEGRLLLAQDFGEHLEWALNGFIEQEIDGDRGREWGFAQSLVTPLNKKESFKIGVEMLFRNFTDKDTRDDPQNSFVIGPTFAWQPSRYTRLDVSPLFGTNDVSPHAQVFVVLSMLFGGTGNEGAEAPASTRNR